MSGESQSNNKRIAKNTLLLYVRMLFTMFVGLFTSRVILKSLGVEDYGIYNVVGGIVAMFAIMSNSLSAAISRFLTYELGRGNAENLKKIFASAVTIQILLALVILVVAETIGLWFLNTQMVIPADRMNAANWVYQFSFLTFATNIISIPYNASIISHEKMSAFACISIIEVLGKLAVAYGVFVSPIDKLVFYGAAMMAIALLLRLIYAWYCKKHFEECTFHFIFDKNLLKKMFAFAGWNFIGASSSVLRTHGANILINLFFGPGVNAARGIATQVYMAIHGFVANFQTAIKPQVTKNYASENYNRMMTLIFQGSKFSFYIMLVFSLPVMVTTPYLMHLWLGIVPEYCVIFVRMALIYALCETMSGLLVTAMLATGNIRNYQLVVGGIQLTNIPISYICLKNGTPPETIYIVAISLSICSEMARLFMLRKMIHLKVFDFLKQVYFKVILVASTAAVIPVLIHHNIDYDLKKFALVCFISLLCTCVSIYCVGLNSDERSLLKLQMQKIVGKIKND